MIPDTLCDAADHADVLFIDGHSGAGKTALARALEVEARRLGRNPVTWHLDELYAGWEGLPEGSAAVARALAGDSVAKWNWESNAPEPPACLALGSPLLIEGCGSLTQTNLRAASRVGSNIVSVWLECDAAVRRERALTRDGDMFRPHWDAWAAAEAHHFARHRPWKIATTVVDTTGTLDVC